VTSYCGMLSGKLIFVSSVQLLWFIQYCCSNQ